MIAMEVFMDIIALRRQGCSLREISRKLGIHRNTVTKYLNGEKPQYRKFKRKDLILGFGGGYDTVKIYVRKVKAAKHRRAFTRFETIPGLQGQMDWADFKISVPGGKDITLYLFVMVLGFSRAMYAELVTRCCIQAFFGCPHERVQVPWWRSC